MRLAEVWSLDPAVLHLNHGSFGAVPRRTQELAAALRSETEANPMAWFRRLPERVAASRRLVAAYLKAEPDGLALVPNASAGVTIALSTIPIPPGGRIVLTDHAYGAVRLAAARIARLRAAEVVVVNVPLESADDEVLAALSSAIDDRTAVVVIDQITSGTAMVFPADRVVALANDLGVPVVVDGAHASGLIDEPVIDGADFWTGDLHKWPCAPRGTAALAVAERWRAATVPLVASWSEDEDLPARFDLQGTDDYVPWLAAPRSLDVLAELDWPRRRTELSAILADACDRVARAIGAAVPKLARPAPTMRLVELPDSRRVDDHGARQALSAVAAREIGAEITVTAHDDRVFLRLSAHAYNSPRDYDLVARRLPAIL